MATDTESAISALEQAQNALDTSQTVSATLEQPWSAELVRFLSIGVLGFSCFALILATVLLWRSNSSPDYVLKIFGVITIVASSVLLLVVGYNNEQLTPIVGLFGAIIGYLLGKDWRRNMDE
ncbi:MAG: hypothetical protein ACRERV_04795 [Methylococcales bacterium]